MIIAAFYGLYSLVRDLHATESGLDEASRNAMHLISIERFFHVFQEQHFQHVVLSWHTYLQVWDTYYGTAHFVAVILVLCFLFFRHPERYPRWRNTLALATALALVGFAFFPVLPPRLLPASYHFVDTLKVIGGPWNFSSGAVAEASNQYAAMPSLHTAWSAWCALAVLPLIRPWWGKVLVCLYPVATIYGIVVTANHYFIDAAGGLVLLGIGYLLSPLVPLVFGRVRGRVSELRRRPATVAGNGHPVTVAGNGHNAPAAGNGHQATMAGNGHQATMAGNGHKTTVVGNAHQAPPAGNGQRWG